MDKKNTAIGVILIIAALVTMYVGNRNSMRRATPETVRQAIAQDTPPSTGPAAIVPSTTEPAIVAATPDHTGAQITTLENSFIQVRFTDYGGAIRDVALVHHTRNGQYQYAAQLGEPAPFVFNDVHADPVLSFVNYPGLDSNARFTLVSKSTSEIIYRTVLPNKVEVTRRYLLPPDEGQGTDPYQLRVETSFRNTGSEATAPQSVAFSLGTAAPVDVSDTGLYLAAWYSDGKSPSSIPRARFESSGGAFGTGLGAHGAAPAIDSPGPVTWAAVSNQFFVAILTPDQAGTSLTSRRVYLPSVIALPATDNRAYGITDSAQFQVQALKPEEKTTLGASYYVGPKEYKRLANTDVFKADQDKVMQFGFFKFFSALLLTLMTWIHSIVPNWGVSIVLTTLTLKTIFIYPTLASLRSSRRMQKLQPQLKIINEKYKDNPQKKNEATMALFKEHKVNPLGGCLPLLLTMPFFFGFYSMLRSTAELRFAGFLWAADLSAPDTVGHLLGIPINILPLMLGLVSFAQVKLSPQPTVDNAQAKMMMFTPLIMLFFCYSFSCALSLYSTTNGLFTIAQQLIINRMKDDGDPAAGKASAGKPAVGGKPLKNVTPSKKK